jgi:hypothetical protein
VEGKAPPEKDDIAVEQRPLRPRKTNEAKPSVSQASASSEAPARAVSKSKVRLSWPRKKVTSAGNFDRKG